MAGELAGELADGFADGPATTLPPPNGAIGSNDAVGDGIDDWLQSGAAEEAGAADQAIVADEAAAAGVDGIITDYPDRLREVLARRGLPLPAPLPMTAR